MLEFQEALENYTAVILRLWPLDSGNLKLPVKPREGGAGLGTVRIQSQ
jgi:hypothetical protein